MQWCCKATGSPTGDQQQDAPWIVALDIPPARAVTAAGGKVIKRVGDSNLQLTGTSLVDFQLAMRSMVSLYEAADGIPVPGADIDLFIDPGRLQLYNIGIKQGNELFTTVSMLLPMQLVMHLSAVFALHYS